MLREAHKEQIFRAVRGFSFIDELMRFRHYLHDKSEFHLVLD